MIPPVELCSGEKYAVLENYRAKFIVVKKDEEYFVYADDKVQWHNEVFESFVRRTKEKGVAVPEKRYFPAGGGKIEVKDGRLKAYDESKGYGRFDVEIVDRLLRPYAASHDLELVIE